MTTPPKYFDKLYKEECRQKQLQADGMKALVLDDFATEIPFTLEDVTKLEKESRHFEEIKKQRKKSIEAVNAVKLAQTDLTEQQYNDMLERKKKQQIKALKRTLED